MEKKNTLLIITDIVLSDFYQKVITIQFLFLCKKVIAVVQGGKYLQIKGKAC